MDILATVLTTVELLSKWGPVVAQGISDLEPFAMSLYERLSSGKQPTEEERILIKDKLKQLHDEFQSPMPPMSQD